MADQPPVEPSPNIGIQLGLGRYWQPGPAGWRWAGLLTDPASGHHASVLAFDTTSGPTGMAMGSEGLRELARQCIEQADALDGKPVVVAPRLTLPQLRGVPGNGRGR